MLTEKVAEADRIKKSQLDMLEKISQFTVDQAKDYLLSKLDEDLVHEKAVRVTNFENQVKEDCEAKARQYISLAISRCAAVRCLNQQCQSLHCLMMR